VERPLVVIELTESLARDISAGGVFVPGCSVQLNEECALVVHGPTEEVELVARVVYVDPRTGVGLELVGFSPALREHLAKLFDAWLGAQVDAQVDAQFDAEVGAQFGGVGAEVDGDAEQTDGRETDGRETDGRETDGPGTDGRETDGRETDGDETDDTKRALSLHERLRGLTMSQQIKIAQRGDQQERMMLERYYNKNVWEPLLRNPKLTAPEVARIARMGTLPRVLLEVIVNNGAWLQVPEVRRALLSNPRLGTDQILRVLRMLPKHELKLAAVQTAYPYAVRDGAKRIIKEQGGDK
jgi:hypothetical protein